MSEVIGMWDGGGVRRALAVLFLLAGPSWVEAATRIYYSVGTDAAVLHSGNASAASGTLTLASAAADNVGVGDQVRVGALANRYYITGRLSSTVFTIQNSAANGGTPGATNITFASTAITIYRAFNTLIAAETGSGDAAHLNTFDLVAGNFQLNLACYNDGPMTMAASAEVDITGHTTDPTRYIRVYTPVSTSEVGVSQRHRGVWGTGFELRGTNADTIQIEDSYVRIEGLTIQATVTTSGEWGGIWANTSGASDIRISHNIVKGVVTAGYPGYGIALWGSATSVNRVWNNIVFNFPNTGAPVYGEGISIDYGNAYVFNNTVYNCEGGIRKYSADSAEVRNNVVIHDTALNPGYVDYDDLDVAPAAVRSSNVSSDATSETVALRNKTAYTTYFKNTTSGSEDLHITNTSLALWASNGANLAADPNIAVTDDIDGGSRSAPDIGADEFGVCCGLTVAEAVGSTITVTGAGQFEMRFSTAAGGGTDQYYDLQEDPTKVNDLVGGSSAGSQDALFIDEVDWAVDGQNYRSDKAVGGVKLDLLEATPTRVRVRSESHYERSTGEILAGVKGVGDHTVPGTGRLAVGWRREVTSPVDVTFEQLQLSVRWASGGAPPFGTWATFSQSGAQAIPGGTQPGGDDFVMLQNEQAGARTDFLWALSADWPLADVTYTGTSVGSGWLEDSWNQNDPRTLAVGSERWSFLFHFKPTNLANHLDAAATSRVADYRGPAVLTINGGKGSQWVGASENTTAGTDWFNEAEAAYALDFDPGQGLDFDVDGSATTRYSPFFKIRQWRSFIDTPSVRLEGTALVKNANYRADVKPVSRAHFAQDLLWHSTLQSSTAVTAPDVGSAGSVVGPPAFATARYGSGASITASTQYVAFPTSDFDGARGALEFWYQPTYDSADGVHHDLCGFSDLTGNVFVLEKPAGDTLDFIFLVSGDFLRLRVAAADYGWRAYDWVHVRLEWDEALPLATQMRLYLNGVEPAHSDPAVDYGSSGLTVQPLFRFGNIDGDATFAPGIFDEIHVYGGSSTTPAPLAHGGLTADASEYLADSAKDYLLALAGVDATRRGVYLSLGADSPFRGLNVSLATAGAGVAAGSLVWEYWNGTTGAWADLEAVAGFTDQTGSFTTSGSLYWTGDPAGWAPYSVNGGPDLYYIRAHLPTGVNYTTTPREKQIRTDILLFQYCGNITAAAQTFQFSVPAPTAVKLMSFSAVPGDSSVTLEWRTGSELDNLGFHLYRGPSADGPWTRLTSSLIPGLGSSPLGQAYSWLDTGLANGMRYYYRLEDVDTASVSTFHGPVSAVPGSVSSPPGEGGEGGGGGDDAEGGGGEPVGGSCPTWILAAAPDAVTPVCTRHGEPDSVSLQVLARGASSATVELRTGGFWVLRDVAGEVRGEVRVFVPGLELPTDAKAPALPLRRALVEAVIGKQVRLVSAQAFDLQSFPGLRPSAVGQADMAIGAGRHGTAGAPFVAGRDSSPADSCRRRWRVFRGRCSRGRGRARSWRSRPCGSTGRVRSWCWRGGCR